MAKNTEMIQFFSYEEMIKKLALLMDKLGINEANINLDEKNLNITFYHQKKDKTYILYKNRT